MKSRSKSDGVFTPFSYRLKKRGQLTIFVIIAILIVAVIFVYFLLIEPNYISGENVQLNFDSCVEGVLSESIIELSLTGGETKPAFYYLYHDYKIRQGYSKLEISQKREALENILVPYRVDENIKLLERNGFEAVDLFFRWFNDYFIAAGNPKFFLGLGWFLFYLIFAIIFGSILRKYLDVV